MSESVLNHHHAFSQDAVAGSPGLAATHPPPGRTTEKADWELRGRPAPDEPMQTIAISAVPFRIGRNSDNNLRLTNRTVSGAHAELIFIENDLFVHDLKSTNGTFLNGRKVQTFEGLHEDDVLRFGTAIFTVRKAEQNDAMATICSTITGDIVSAHLQFERLLNEPAVIPYYQPVIRLDDTQGVGYEVLARSRLPGLENPATMFRIADERDQASELSCLMRREGLRIGQRLGADTRFYLNTHPSEIHTPEMLDSLERLRDEFPDLPIMLEIHEVAITSPQLLRNLQERLSELDVGLAYDDFGAGQSRLLELADTPPDVIKFDMHLIRGLPNVPAERLRMLESLVAIVRDLRVISLAEGIETAEEASTCRDLGFELAQGYFFGRPSPVDSWLD